MANIIQPYTKNIPIQRMCEQINRSRLHTQIIRIVYAYDVNKNERKKPSKTHLHAVPGTG